MINTDNKFELKFTDFFKGGEIYVFIVSILYTVMLFLLWSKFQNPFLLLNYNVGIMLITLTLAVLSHFYSKYGWVRVTRLILLAGIVYMIYLNTQNYVKILNPYLYDQILIRWDRAIFGKDLSRYFDGLRFPLLTEFLQLCYVVFFFLPMFHGVILFREKKITELNELYNQIIFGFLLSYLLYFIMPAIGPRFTLYDFNTLELDMPGVWLTDYARIFINSGGGAPPGTLNPAELVNRDCMPSGHTMLTLINMLLAYKFSTKHRWFFYIVGTGLIISTLYLRYHYGVDVVAGIAFAFISLYIEPKIRKFLVKKRIVDNSI